MSRPEIESKLEKVGLYPTVTCGETFAGFLRAKKDEYARVIREANIKVDK